MSNISFTFCSIYSPTKSLIPATSSSKFIGLTGALDKSCFSLPMRANYLAVQGSLDCLAPPCHVHVYMYIQCMVRVHVCIYMYNWVHVHMYLCSVALREESSLLCLASLAYAQHNTNTYHVFTVHIVHTYNIYIVHIYIHIVHVYVYCKCMGIFVHVHMDLSFTGSSWVWTSNIHKYLWSLSLAIPDDSLPHTVTS